MHFYYDWTIILILPVVILSLWAQSNVNSNFKKYSQVYSRIGLTAAEVTRRILDLNGLTNVRIERIAGNLTDNFNPKDNVIRLSDSTYQSTSVAAIGVAAHEAGHAVQYAKGYAPIKVRNSIVPAVNACSVLSLPIVIIGMIFAYPTITHIGIILFSATVLFQLITLPVEFNASRRALETLENERILDSDEMVGARNVLKAAALTYIVAALASALSLLRLILLSNGRRRG